GPFTPASGIWTPAFAGVTAEIVTAEAACFRDHGGVLPSSARPARYHPSSVFSVSSAVNPSSAGHGVHRSDSQQEPIGVHLRSSAAKPAFPAGHGVHRSILE